MKPLTSQRQDGRSVIWSQQRPRRRVEAGYLTDEARGRPYGGGLVIQFVGFDSGVNSSEKVIEFFLPQLWFPRFSRRLKLPAGDLLAGLCDRVDSPVEAEQLHAWLWSAEGVYNPYRSATERAATDRRLAARRPAFPTRLAGVRHRTSIMRRELLRSFDEGEEFLAMTHEAYYSACAQVAGVPRSDLTPEMYLWAYPEVGIDYWDDPIEMGGVIRPIPVDDDIIELVGFSVGMGVMRGASIYSYCCGDTDLWIPEGGISYGRQPATRAARWSMLQTAAIDLSGGQGDEFILEGLDTELESRFRSWCDERWGRKG